MGWKAGGSVRVGMDSIHKKVLFTFALVAAYVFAGSSCIWGVGSDEISDDN
jgi:hypothetical protein